MGSNEDHVQELQGMSMPAVIREFVWPAVCRIEDEQKRLASKDDLERFRTQEFIPVRDDVARLHRLRAGQQQDDQARAQREKTRTSKWRYRSPLLISIAMLAVVVFEIWK